MRFCANIEIWTKWNRVFWIEAATWSTSTATRLIWNIWRSHLSCKMAIFMAFQTLSRNISKYLEIFSPIVNLRTAVATWYTDAFWSSVICLFLSKLAPCEHFICRHSQKLQCNPLKHSRVALNIEHSNWLVTADVLNFLHANHGEVFERFVWWLTRAPFKEFFQIWKNKNTKCPIDAHCHRHCRRDPRIIKAFWQWASKLHFRHDF